MMQQRGDNMTYRKTAAAVFAVAALGFGGIAAAQWPERPITLIVPFPAGGGTDTFARPLAQQLTTQLGQAAWPPRRGPTAIPSSWAARTTRWPRRWTRA
ncbi:hypothetical protein G6F57_021780 [Rhizopus arrhizus]|nr:hypothetical protein G6F57_021780 [Rhizopus arrhizus]